MVDKINKILAAASDKEKRLIGVLLRLERDRLNQEAREAPETEPEEVSGTPRAWFSSPL